MTSTNDSDIDTILQKKSTTAPTTAPTTTTSKKRTLAGKINPSDDFLSSSSSSTTSTMGGGGVNEITSTSMPVDELFKLVIGKEYAALEPIIPHLDLVLCNSKSPSSGIPFACNLAILAGNGKTETSHINFTRLLITLIERNQKLDLNAVVEQGNRKYQGMTMLMIAASNNNHDLCRAIIEHPDSTLANSDNPKHISNTVINVIVTMKPDVELVRLVLDSGKDAMINLEVANKKPLEYAKIRLANVVKSDKEGQDKWSRIISMLEHYSEYESLNGYEFVDTKKRPRDDEDTTGGDDEDDAASEQRRRDNIFREESLKRSTDIFLKGAGISAEDFHREAASLGRKKLKLDDILGFSKKKTVSF